MRSLGEDDIQALALGAWILGTGGGGDPYHSYLNLQKLHSEDRFVQLVSPDEIGDDSRVAVLSYVGAPTVALERINDPAMFARAIRAMESYACIKFDAVLSLEIGGANGLQGAITGALLGLPLVDADAMGRAYPEAQMTSFAVHELPMFPVTMSDVRDNEVILTRAASWTWTERISRAICVEMGSFAAVCDAPRTGREVKDYAIHGTVTRAIEIGRAVMAARAKHRDPIEAVLDTGFGKLLFCGKVSSVDRSIAGGFLRGKTTIEGLDEWKGQSLSVDFQNEYVVAASEGQPLASTPDLICILEKETGEAIGTETLRYGQQVAVLVGPAAPVFLTAKGLDYVGPRAFGYDFDFVTVFS